jgi:very-short-patch-repair endonuclease
VPDGLSPRSEHVLVAAAEWLVHHGRFTVWLAGTPLRFVDRIRTVAITLPEYLRHLGAEVDLAVEETATSAEHRAPPPSAARATPPVVAVVYPPVSGAPRQDSAAEQALERALAPHEWAQGRCWNHTYEWRILARPYRLDLFWPEDGVVIEVDGSEHRGRFQYADDRARDVNLQLCGYDVLRFTNEQVLWDVQAVATKIEQLLRRRRAAGAPILEMVDHAEH